MNTPRIPWEPPKDDDAERFYAAGEMYINKCNLCGSLGTLYHFNGWQEICPFCVIKEARKELIAKADAVIGAYADRWVHVTGLSTAELDTLRDLNDLLNELVPERMSPEQREAMEQFKALKEASRPS